MISQYRHGHKPAGKKFLLKLAKAVGRPVDEFHRRPPPGTGAAVAESIPPYGATFTARVVFSPKFGQPGVPAVRETEYIAVPIVEARVAAGIPEVVTSEQTIDVACIHRRAPRGRSPRALICTAVKGDSMEPVLRDGAIVCIDTKARPEGKKIPAGSIRAVRKDDGVVVKFLRIRDNTLVLVPRNEAYQVELVKDPEAIAGRVIRAWQALQRGSFLSRRSSSWRVAAISRSSTGPTRRPGSPRP